MTYVLPNLFIPGAQKSATKTLHAYLASHPEIAMTPNMEPHYFTRPDKNLDDYERLFVHAGGAKYRGERSTGYMMSPTAVGRIASVVDDPRFVFVFRNPIDRAWSHYTWITGHYAEERRPFREAFLTDLASKPVDPMPNNAGYYHGGTYDVWLGLYQETFGADAVMFVKFEDLITSPLRTVNGICDFLGLTPLSTLAPQHINRTESFRFQAIGRLYARIGRVSGNVLERVLPDRALVAVGGAYRASGDILGRILTVGNAPPMDDDTRGWLGKHYRHSVERLRESTGDEFEAWKNDFP